MVFRMNGNRQPKPSGLAQPFQEGEIISPRKLIQSGMTKECLEPDDTAIRELGHLQNISGNDTAPDREIRHTCGLERADFSIEFTSIHRAGNGIERHIEKQRTTARGERAAARGTALPLGVTRLIEVNMNIDGSGKYH